MFVLPAALMYGAFLLFPLGASLVGSVFEWEGMSQGGFVGLANYQGLFSAVFWPRVWGAFWHSVAWVAGIMVTENVVAFALAYLLYLDLRGSKVFRTVFFVPAVLSPIVVGALWRLLLHPFGAVNKVLSSLGLPAPAWLGDPSLALPVLILVDAWNWIGFPLLIFLAALNDIPREVLEASEIDGARGFGKLRNVILPLLTPAISTISVFTLINSMNQFDIVYIMAGVTGSPEYSTDVLNTLFYRLAFGSQGGSGITEIGMALALATMMLGCLGLATAAALRFFQAREVQF